MWMIQHRDFVIAFVQQPDVGHAGYLYLPPSAWTDLWFYLYYVALSQYGGDWLHAPHTGSSSSAVDP